MKRALLAVVLAACAAAPPAPQPPEPRAVVEAGAPDAVAALPPIPAPTTRGTIEAFAAARGGLHGEPVAMPYRSFRLKGTPCFLFFVGGDAAQAAWLATPWDAAWGKASAALPHVSAMAQAPLLQDGVVFERVDAWPRAVRVVGASPAPDGVFVKVESLATRDQPAGATATLRVAENITGGSMPTASPEWAAMIGAAEGVPEKSLPSILRAPPSKPIDVYESWQAVLVRRARATPRAIAATIASAHCRWNGVCLDDDGRGAVIVRDGSRFRVGAVMVAPASVPVAKEPAPVPAPPDDALASFRANETATGALRPVTSVTIGTNHLLVVSDDRATYLVEHDGPFSRVTSLLMPRSEKAAVEARLDDVDGDGVLDVILLARWPKTDDKDPFEVHTEVAVARRFDRVSAEVVRDAHGIEIDLAGMTNIDDAVRRAHAPVSGVTPTKIEACTLLAASSTPRGLVAHATANARIVSFDEPMQPARAVRVVPVARATAADAATLKDACNDPSEGGFQCRGGLCGNLDYGLGSLYRFVRERGVLKLESALLYTGS